MRKTILIIAAIFSFAFSSFAATCQSGTDPQDRKWQDRVNAEKIAYLTTVMELTPKEAQSFWPLYNKATKESEVAMGAFMRAYEELDRAVKQGKPANEISALVNKYVEAEKASRSIDAKYVPQYLKIISAEKVAKLFVGEEDFRRIQMRRFATGRNNQPRGNNGNPSNKN